MSSGLRRRRAIIGIAAASAGVAGWWWAGSGDGPAATHRVEIRTFAYEPAAVEARTGDAIEWVNHDIVEHTVTAVDGSWDSGPIPPGGRWRSPPAGAATHDYLCTLHPTMVGSVIIR